MQRALRRQGLSKFTCDSHAWDVWRLECWVDAPLREVVLPHFKHCFYALIESHSWSTVKVLRCGLQFFNAQVRHRRRHRCVHFDA